MTHDGNSRPPYMKEAFIPPELGDKLVRAKHRHKMPRKEVVEANRRYDRERLDWRTGKGEIDEAMARRWAVRGWKLPVPDATNKPLTELAVRIAERRGLENGSTRWHYVRQQAYIAVCEANLLGQKDVLAKLADRIRDVAPSDPQTDHQEGEAEMAEFILTEIERLQKEAAPIDGEE